MESRKMVLNNLFAGTNGETDIENRLMDTERGKERVRRMERVTWKLVLPYVKQIANGILCMSQGIETGALYQPRGVGWGEFQKGCDVCIPMADSC